MAIPDGELIEAEVVPLDDDTVREVATRYGEKVTEEAFDEWLAAHDAALLAGVARRRNDREAKWCAQRLEALKMPVAKAIYAGLITRVQGGQFDVD